MGVLFILGSVKCDFNDVKKSVECVEKNNIDVIFKGVDKLGLVGKFVKLLGDNFCDVGV